MNETFEFDGDDECAVVDALDDIIDYIDHLKTTKIVRVTILLLPNEESK